jgi:hypothetical protein
MTDTRTRRRPPAITRRSAIAAIAGSLASLAGCGGGGTPIAGISSGGTGSFTTGTVTGLGSIIVNGIRWDDSQAQRVRRDGQADDGSALQIGRVVDIVGSRATPAAVAGARPTATATMIRWGAEWVGPIDTGSRSDTGFTILGHPVDVTATTIVDGAVTRLADLADGDVVEVDGHLDLSVQPARLLATRIERATQQPSVWRVSGTVRTRTPAADPASGTFSLGGDLIAYGPSTEVPSAWGVGTVVGVRLDTTGPTPYAALRVTERLAPSRELGVEDDEEAELEGLITAWNGAASFAVNGVPVDASAASDVPAGLDIGVRVEVEGRLVGGVVRAQSVTLHQEDTYRDEGFELHGTVNSLDSSAKTFLLQRARGQTIPVRFDAQTVFDPPGTTLADGQAVELKARRLDGQWKATQIEVESADAGGGLDEDSDNDNGDGDG